MRYGVFLRSIKSRAEHCFDMIMVRGLTWNDLFSVQILTFAGVFGYFFSKLLCLRRLVLSANEIAYIRGKRMEICKCWHFC